MAEGTTPREWHDIDRRHRAGILLGAAVLLVAVVAGLAALLGGEPAGEAGGEVTRTITPAEQTTDAVIPVPSYEPSASQDAEGAGTADPGDTEPSAPGAASTGDDVLPTPTLVAYRRDGWLCVAALDGSGERRVTESASGVFSLSPDGATIASVDADRHLRLYDVATGSARDLGPMENERPSWSPDSQAVLYTAPGPTVRRYARQGGRQTILFEGRAPVFTHDGGTVVAVSPPSEEPAVLIWRDDRLERHVVDAPITTVACTADRIYFGTAPSADGSAALGSMPLAGTGIRVEAQARESARSVSIGSLLVSPDGSRVVYAEHGDDGFSRVYAVQTGSGSPVSVSGRRDAYPLQWADGDTLLLVEGNPLQGEPTALASVSITSGVRKLLVEGASL